MIDDRTLDRILNYALGVSSGVVLMSMTRPPYGWPDWVCVMIVGAFAFFAIFRPNGSEPPK